PTQSKQSGAGGLIPMEKILDNRLGYHSWTPSFPKLGNPCIRLVLLEAPLFLLHLFSCEGTNVFEFCSTNPFGNILFVEFFIRHYAFLHVSLYRPAFNFSSPERNSEAEKKLNLGNCSPIREIIPEYECFVEIIQQILCKCDFCLENNMHKWDHSLSFCFNKTEHVVFNVCSCFPGHCCSNILWLQSIIRRCFQCDQKHGDAPERNANNGK
ncbi:unnamed protein product, partial [Allacma fusca]